MAVRIGDKWKVDFRPEGKHGPRVRKLFSTKAEAERYEPHVRSKATHGEWNPKPKDNRRLSELAQL